MTVYCQNIFCLPARRLLRNCKSLGIMTDILRCSHIATHDSIYGKVVDCKILHFIIYLIAVSRFITVASKQKAETKALFSEPEIDEEASAAKIIRTTTRTWEEKESIFWVYYNIFFHFLPWFFYFILRWAQLLRKLSTANLYCNPTYHQHSWINQANLDK